jgi:hypothetical protein
MRFACAFNSSMRFACNAASFACSSGGKVITEACCREFAGEAARLEEGCSSGCINLVVLSKCALRYVFAFPGGPVAMPPGGRVF